MEDHHHRHHHYHPYLPHLAPSSSSSAVSTGAPTQVAASSMVDTILDSFVHHQEQQDSLLRLQQPPEPIPEPPSCSPSMPTPTLMHHHEPASMISPPHHLRSMASPDSFTLHFPTSPDIPSDPPPPPLPSPSEAGSLRTIHSHDSQTPLGGPGEPLARDHCPLGPCHVRGSCTSGNGAITEPPTMMVGTTTTTTVAPQGVSASFPVLLQGSSARTRLPQPIIDDTLPYLLGQQRRQFQPRASTHPPPTTEGSTSMMGLVVATPTSTSARSTTPADRAASRPYMEAEVPSLIPSSSIPTLMIPPVTFSPPSCSPLQALNTTREVDLSVVPSRAGPLVAPAQGLPWHRHQQEQEAAAEVGMAVVPSNSDVSDVLVATTIAGSGVTHAGQLPTAGELEREDQQQQQPVFSALVASLVAASRILAVMPPPPPAAASPAQSSRRTNRVGGTVAAPSQRPKHLQKQSKRQGHQKRRQGCRRRRHQPLRPCSPLRQTSHEMLRYPSVGHRVLRHAYSADGYELRQRRWSSVPGPPQVNDAATPMTADAAVAATAYVTVPMPGAGTPLPSTSLPGLPLLSPEPGGDHLVLPLVLDSPTALPSSRHSCNGPTVPGDPATVLLITKRPPPPPARSGDYNGVVVTASGGEYGGGQGAFDELAPEAEAFERDSGVGLYSMNAFPSAGEAGVVPPTPLPTLAHSLVTTDKDWSPPSSTLVPKVEAFDDMLMEMSPPSEARVRKESPPTSRGRWRSSQARAGTIIQKTGLRDGSSSAVDVGGGGATESERRTKRFPCLFPGCRKVFSRAHNLKSHSLIHTTFKPFPCAHCPVRFSRNHDLRRHMRMHSGERPYRCARCDKGFARSDALRRHGKANKCLAPS